MRWSGKAFEGLIPFLLAINRHYAQNSSPERHAQRLGTPDGAASDIG